MKALIYLFAFACLLLFTNFQCDEPYSCGGLRGESALNVALGPEKVTYAIGDTFFLQTDIGTSFPAQNSNELLDIKNGSCYLSLLIMKLGGNPDSLKGYADFDVINLSGYMDQEYISDPFEKRYEGNIHFNCDSMHCGFQIGLIPKVQGNYCVSLSIGRVIAQDTSFCPDILALYDNVFDVTNYHREIFYELGIHYPIRLPTMYSALFHDVIEDDGSYAFKVK